MLKYIAQFPEFDDYFHKVTFRNWQSRSFEFIPLQYACDRGDLELVEYLFQIAEEKRINVFRTLQPEDNIEDVAKEKGFDGIVEKFRKARFYDKINTFLFFGCIGTWFLLK